MATLDDAAIQLANSLQVEAVPAKLRCASCNKLAVNAVKLPCCDQSICEPCSHELPETCPICSHSPISAEDCKPNKSLRMTVKAFIKNEEKKRAKESEPPPTPAVEPTPTSQQAGKEADSAVESIEKATTPMDGVPTDVQDDSLPTADVHVANVPGQGEVVAEQASNEQTNEEDEDEEDDEDDEDDVIITTERPETETAEEQQQYGGDEGQKMGEDGQSFNQGQMNGQQGFGFDSSQQGFNNMDFGAMNGFNPMMAMQNGGMGMPNFGMGMGMPNMMGMPMGMNMDPSMMFNGGFGGMGGMNDMSMMMAGMGGMGNFGGGMGMGGGANGPASSGFFPGNAQGGYMNQQQNFGNNMHQNFHHNRGYGGRPYGRGGYQRGGRSNWGGGYNRGGRGGWQNYGQGPQGHGSMNQQYQQQTNVQQNSDENNDPSAAQNSQSGRRGSPSYEPMKAADGTHATDAQAHQDRVTQDNESTDQTGVDAANHTVEVADKVPQTEDVTDGASNDVQVFEGEGAKRDTGTSVKDVDPSGDSVAIAGATPSTYGDVNAEQQNQSYEQTNGYGSHGRGGFVGARGGFRGRGGAYGYVATAVGGEPETIEAPPVNAPTGPKAMREGLPNSGWYSRRPEPKPRNVPAVVPPVASPIQTDTVREHGYNERDRSHSRSLSRSEYDDRRETRRSRDDKYDSDNDSRRKDRERRKRRDRERKYDDEQDEDSSRKARSRSQSPSAGHSRRHRREKDDEGRSSRSHRDRSKDKHRRRHRSRSHDKDVSVNGEDYDSSRRKSKSDRRHREEDYDDDRLREKDRSSRRSSKYDIEGYSSKDRTSNSRHDRSSRHDRDRDHEKHQSVLEEPQDEIGFKIKGTKSAAIKAGIDTSMAPPPSRDRGHSHRRSSTHDSAPQTPNTPHADPYAEERERRQRERLDRENSIRRQSTSSLGKRVSRDEDELDVPTGPREDRMMKKPRRKMAVKYEDEIGYAR